MFKKFSNLSHDDKVFLAGYFAGAFIGLFGTNFGLWLSDVYENYKEKKKVRFAFAQSINVAHKDPDYINNLIDALYEKYNLDIEYPKFLTANDLDFLAFYGTAKKKDYEKFIKDFSLTESKSDTTDLIVLFGQNE